MSSSGVRSAVYSVGHLCPAPGAGLRSALVPASIQAPVASSGRASFRRTISYTTVAFAEMRRRYQSRYVPAHAVITHTTYLRSPQVEESNDSGWDRKGAISFRYDPAVLIVSLNFSMAHGRATFGRCLHQQMSLKYFGHEDLVGLSFKLHVENAR